MHCASFLKLNEAQRCELGTRPWLHPIVLGIYILFSSQSAYIARLRCQLNFFSLYVCLLNIAMNPADESARHELYFYLARLRSLLLSRINCDWLTRSYFWNYKAMNFQKRAPSPPIEKNLAALPFSFFRPVWLLHVFSRSLRLIKRSVLIKCRSNKYAAVGNCRAIALFT